MEAVLSKSLQSNFRALVHQLRVSGVFSFASLLLELAILWALAHWGGVSSVGQWFLALAISLPVFVWGNLPRRLSSQGSTASLVMFLEIQVLLYLFMVLVFLAAKFLGGLSWSTFGLWVLALSWLAIRQWGPRWKRHGAKLRLQSSGVPFSYREHCHRIFQYWKDQSLEFGQISLEWLILALPVYGLFLWGGWELLGYFAVVGFWLCTHRAWIHPHWLPGRKRLREAIHQGQVEAFERLFLKQLSYGIILALAALLLVSLLGAELLDLSFGPAYARHEALLVWMVAAGALWAVQGYFRQTRLLLQPAKHPLADTALWLALQFFFVLAMIPHLGLSGAAWSLFFLALLRSLTQVIRLEQALREIGTG